MKNWQILASIIFIIVVVAGVSFLYLNREPSITGAATLEKIDLKTFNYSAVTDKSELPRVNVTGVIDNICLYRSLPLWNRAGGGKAEGQMSITVKGCPGTPMIITEVQQYGNTTWFKVQKFEKRGDLQMWWEGWVPDKVILQGPLPILLEEYRKQLKK